MIDPNRWAAIYRGTRVLLTGHTGFKGSWLSIWLERLGATVCGYSLEPPTTPALFTQAGIADLVVDVRGDVRDRDHLLKVWREFQPDIVFHLAAQPLVRASYELPLDTITTNVLGTTHVLDVARVIGEPVAVVLITSDKCYENVERHEGYREDDRLGGRDVYSGSKAAAEIIISSYRSSFFGGAGHVAAASARAGNVIGGGDWATHRLVPDAIRALMAEAPLVVRNPEATRPWQHVLEPLSGYLHLGATLLEPERPDARTAWNFGPAPHTARSVADVASMIVEDWGSGSWEDGSEPDAPHEATLLQLDISKAVHGLGWAPRFTVEEAVASTVAWYRSWHQGGSPLDLCREQIGAYETRAPIAVVPVQTDG